MEDNLDEQLQQYQNIWKNIKNKEFTEPLPIIDIKSQIDKFTKELQNSFSADTTDNVGKSILNHLDTIHKITRQAHLLRDFMYTTGSSLQLMRGTIKWQET